MGASIDAWKGVCVDVCVASCSNACTYDTHEGKGGKGGKGRACRGGCAGEQGKERVTKGPYIGIPVVVYIVQYSVYSVPSHSRYANH